MDQEPINKTVVGRKLATVLTSLPPRLSMDEYADFVEDSLRESDPAYVTRQKELEEHIRAPFRIAGASLPAGDGKNKLEYSD